jgi:selenocysteine lyase/cysteine desulfurase
MISPSRRNFMAQMVSGAALGALATLPVETGAATAPESSAGVAAPDDESYWRWVADQFVIRDDVTYMNTGTRGPSPRSVVQAQCDAIRAYDTDRLSYARHVQNEAFRERLHEKMAAFLGCDPDEVALTNNTTEGMAFGTFGPDMQPGDEIIYTNHDHSSGAQPINLRAARYGVKPVMVDLSDAKFHPPASPDQISDVIEAAITPRTRLISFCHINYTDGCVLPARQICAMARDKGILTLVDGAHPPGMMDLDLHDLGCDMYAGAGHKFLLASMLTGIFYVRRDVQDRIWPTVYSGPVDGMSMYGTEQPPSSYLDRSKTACKFEIHGSGSYATQASLDAALDFHNAISPRAIEARDHYLAARVREGLSEIPGVQMHASDDPALGCGLVAFKLRNVPTVELNDLLWDRHRIYIRNVTHPEIGWDINRASLHIMVNANQVDNFIGAVGEIAKERRS